MRPVPVGSTVDPAGLAYGAYTAELVFTAPGATHSPQVVPLTFLYTDQPPAYLPLIVE